VNVTCQPDPFPAPAGFQILVTGGHPPYEYEPKPSPPNPPGVKVSPTGYVTVPPGTPPDTTVEVDVSDSSVPTPQTATASARTI
jgi:hypothetical protein